MPPMASSDRVRDCARISDSDEKATNSPLPLATPWNPPCSKTGLRLRATRTHHRKLTKKAPCGDEGLLARLLEILLRRGILLLRARGRFRRGENGGQVGVRGGEESGDESSAEVPRRGHYGNR